MPILPIIDLLIFGAWTSLMIGVGLKAIWVTTTYRPHLFGLAPPDFLLGTGICLLFALALAARVWVKSNEARQESEWRAGSPPREVDHGAGGLEVVPPPDRDPRRPGNSARR
ncbi:MAG: hypothetical protein JSU66_14200 [Deltaproteobacteria bacterium]|nr:MAG: hypothetical protein JSU66_14200 [Deltaproteobacteria bacterium]